MRWLWVIAVVSAGLGLAVPPFRDFFLSVAAGALVIALFFTWGFWLVDRDE